MVLEELKNTPSLYTVPGPMVLEELETPSLYTVPGPRVLEERDTPN